MSASNGNLFPDNVPISKESYVPQFGPVEEVVKRLTSDPWEIESLVRCWRYYCRRTERGAGYMATDKRLKAGLRRLRDCVVVTGDRDKALQFFKLAIDGLADDDFLAGKNDRHKEYRDWLDHLCKNWERFERMARA